jgi:hypothetical protein
MSVVTVMDDRPDRSRMWRRVQWLSLGLILLGCCVGIAVPAGAGWDFANFYDAGHRVAAGQIRDLYDPTSQIDGRPPQGTMRFWGTPLSALFYAPLSWFPAPMALVLFKIQNVLAIVAACVVLFAFGRRFVPDSSVARARFAALCAVLALVYQPFWTVFRVGGQTTPTVFLLLAAGMVFHTGFRDWASAVCVVLAVVIKPALAPALLCLLCLSGRSFLVKAVVVGLSAGLASIALLGWPAHRAFLDLMRHGVQFTFPWFYNSSLYVLVDTLHVALGGRPETRFDEPVMAALTLALKAVVLATIAFLVVKSRRRRWPPAARRHFALVLSILFFLWWSPTLWEHYLALLFIPLVYVVASAERFSRSALVLVGAVFVVSLAQNIILMDWLRRHASFDSPLALAAIGLLKTAPLVLMLVFVWRHYRELFESYEVPAWERMPRPQDRSRA